MDDSTFFKGKLERVYYDIGTFPGQSEHKFIKAPFDVLKVNGQTYIVPLTFGGGTTSNVSMSGVLANDETGELNVAQQGGWYDTMKNIVMQEHEMGDWKGDRDNWLQVHRYGLV